MTTSYPPKVAAVRAQLLELLGIREARPEDGDVVHREVGLRAMVLQDQVGQRREAPHGDVLLGRYIGPLMPPSFRTRQKWIMISSATANGIATQWST